VRGERRAVTVAGGDRSGRLPSRGAPAAASATGSARRSATPRTYDHGVDGRLYYKGTLSGDSLADGPHSLFVTALDNSGRSAQATVDVGIDRGTPTLTIAAPLQDTVAHPSTDFDVTCTDPLPGCAIEVRDADGVLLANSTDHLKTTLSFASYGDKLNVSIAVTNRGGSTISRTRNLFVEPAQVKLDTVIDAPGRIESFDGDPINGSIVYWDNHDSGVYTQPDDSGLPARGLLWLPFSPSAPSALPLTMPWLELPDWWIGDRIVMLPTAILYLEFDGIGFATKVQQWKLGDTKSTSLPSQHIYELRRAGDYVAWNGGLFNVSTGQLTALPPSVSVDVGSNGKVAYIDYDGKQGRYSVTFGNTQLASSTTGSITGVVTDGTLVLYEKLNDSTKIFSLVLYDGVSEQELSPGETQFAAHDRDYRVNGGWVAWIARPASGSSFDIWRRSPKGKQEKVVTLDGTGRLEALSPTGVILFQQVDRTGASHRYGSFSNLEEPLADIGSGLGHSQLGKEDGLHYFPVYVRIGRSLLKSGWELN
jgi:hypothetical protein